ncbi:hypothetical protein [uncultured Neglectibacter sp.]|uniref:hypothetical protein n=1 Tax=uncultured Neglectibacter sp. TaxID=1924108 RepID=UPI0034DDEEA6
MFKRKLKRIVGLVLSAVLLLSSTALPVSAEENHGEVGKNSMAEDIYFLPEEVATEIGRLFLEDMKKEEYTAWNEDTEVVSTTPLYAEDGETYNAYCIEFTIGYVVVAAHADVSSPILEWSDTEEPYYAEMEKQRSTRKIVYLGALDYLADNGSDTLVSAIGEEVPRNELVNTLEERRDEKYVNAETAEAIAEITSNDGKRRINTPNWPGGYIIDPFIYANKVYGGTFYNVNWANHWYNIVDSDSANFNFAIMSDFAKNEPNCCPTAITNMIRMYGRKYNDKSILQDSYTSIYSKVMSANYGYYVPEGDFFKNFGGVPPEKAPKFLQDAFYKYYINTVSTTTDMYQLNYQEVKKAFSSPDKLIMVGLLKNDSKHPYGSHALVGYAYTRICNDKVYRAFVKVGDGRNRIGRYIEIDAVSPGSQCFTVSLK